MTVVNIRGINGSGKTTLARRGLEFLRETVLSDPYTNRFGSARPGWPMHVCDVPALDRPLVVHGRYDIQQGGCDTEKDMDVVDVCLRAGFERFPHSHHLFEGFIVSKSSKRFARLAEDFRHMGWTFIILDPGLDECVRRIMVRNGGRKQPNRDLMRRSLESDVLRCERDFLSMGWPRVVNTPAVEDLWSMF